MAALADLVVDLLRQDRGDETMDGDALDRAIREAYEPIRIVRQDRPLPPRSPDPAKVAAGA